ncbi:MAG: AMP-binding protein [Candidatus Cloacimonetes bacterium]|nr:AMP-binding protein [Candidatus Cloacimonadota bacterium]
MHKGLGQNLYHGLWQSANKNPEAVLVKSASGIETYSAILKKANRIGSYLKKQVKTGTRIGLLIPSIPECIPLLYGVIAADLIGVPMNFVLQPLEQKKAMDLAQLSLVIGLDEMLEPLRKNSSVPCLSLQELMMASSLESDACLEPVRFDRDVALILFTSGTSSASVKGVSLSHYNLMSNVSSCKEVFQFTSQDCFLSVLPFFHCFALTVNLLLPTQVGASIYMMPRFKPQDVLQVISSEQISIAALVPAMIKVFLQLKPDAELLRKVRLYISGGEALGVAAAQAMLKRYDIVVAEGYGMTEAAPVLTANFRQEIGCLGGVGHSLPGVQIKIMGLDGQNLGPNQVGEVLFRSEGLMEGYFGLEDPYEGRLRDGWFHTGDLGYLSADNALFLEGRCKDLIISAGENISPREIEEAALNLPLVQEACAFAMESELRGEEPALAVSPASVNQDELRRHLRATLASYKVPKKIYCMDELPKSATGKVLKRMVRALCQG